MTPDPTKPAGTSAAGPVTLDAEAHQALLRKAEMGAAAHARVEALEQKLAKSEAASLDSERERLMADLGLTKEEVSACPDLPSLKALESVARKGKASRTPADPAKAGANDKTADELAAQEVKEWNTTLQAKREYILANGGGDA